MLICIDVGNTNITYGIYKERELVCTFKCDTNETTSENKMYDDFMLALNEYGLLAYDMEFAIISCGKERMIKIIKYFCLKLNIECYFIDIFSPLGLENKLNEKTDLAPDIFVECYMASINYPLPLVVIDFGNATVMTLVNENREIEGQVILPGIVSTFKILTSKSNRGGRLSFYDKETVLGKDTISAVESGMMNGTVNAINGILESIREEKNYEYMNVITSGGLAGYIYEHIDGAIFKENLLLDGLNDIYNDIGKKLYLRTKDRKVLKTE